MLDLRIPSGWFFLLLGVILVALGLFQPQLHAALTDVNVNLYSGVPMLVFGGAAFAGWPTAQVPEGMIAEFRGKPMATLAITRAWFRAPGRVNLIGEHTDYNLGFVLPMALQMACHIAVATERPGRRGQAAYGIGRTAASPIAFDLARRLISPIWSRGGDWTRLSDRGRGAAKCWFAPARNDRVRPTSLILWSTVPVGSGVELIGRAGSGDRRMALPRLSPPAD